jgi:dTDP-4-amino-4,6-dideoxygalactose transaminase
MNEISAAMGLTSLESLDEFVDINYINYKQYQTHLADVPGVTLAAYDEREKSNYQYIILEIEENQAGVSRNQLVDILWAENVLARRYFYPGCHRMEPYRSYYPHAGLLLPETERLAQCLMALPTGTAVTTQDIQDICHIIRLVIKDSAEVQRRLQQPLIDADLMSEWHQYALAAPNHRSP